MFNQSSEIWQDLAKFNEIQIRKDLIEFCKLEKYLAKLADFIFNEVW